MPEFVAQFRDFPERFAQSLFVTRHSAFVPQEKAKLAVERIGRSRAVHVQQFLEPCVYTPRGLFELGGFGRRPFSPLTSGMTRQRVGQNKIAVRETWT